MFSAIWNFLSSSLLFWEIAGYACTTIVILGCVGEYIAEFTRVPKDQERKDKISKLSLIVLTIGIAGELLTAIQSSRISSQVISDLEGTVTVAKQSAQEAADSAGRAKAASDNAVAKAGNALDKSAQAIVQTGELNSKLDTERTQLSELEQKRKGLEKSVADLTEKIKFRHVSLDQSAKISAELLAHPPGTIEIDVLPSADDGDEYCRDLWKAIHNGGWNGTFGATTLLYSGAHDLFFVVKDTQKVPVAALYLLKALGNAGITGTYIPDPRLGSDQMLLIVGPKTK